MCLNITVFLAFYALLERISILRMNTYFCCHTNSLDTYVCYVSVKGRGTPMTMEYDTSMPTQRSRVSGSESLVSDPRVTIDKIQEQGLVSSFSGWFNIYCLSLLQGTSLFPKYFSG